LPSEYDNVEKYEIEHFYKLISENVKRYRIEKGFSQMELALEIGIKSVAFFSNAECNRYNKHFNMEHIYKIAKALNMKFIDFIPPEDYP